MEHILLPDLLGVCRGIPHIKVVSSPPIELETLCDLIRFNMRVTSIKTIQHADNRIGKQDSHSSQQ